MYIITQQGDGEGGRAYSVGRTTEAASYNYSVGAGQVNSRGVDTHLVGIKPPLLPLLPQRQPSKGTLESSSLPPL